MSSEEVSILPWMSAEVTDRPFPDELPRLLDEKGLTLRALAREVGGIDHSYLSRMLYRRTAVNVRHAERIARALGLPPDYFPEVREAAVVEAVRKNPRLRDSIYFDQIVKRSRH
jgi:transcriptional regulator with XRE-family HTH domain